MIYYLSSVSRARVLSTHRFFSSSSVYIWGSGDNGELAQEEIEKAGIRNTYEELLPLEASSLTEKRVTRLACGDKHAMAVTEEGKLFAWGNLEYEKLGLDVSEAEKQSKIVAVPRQVSALEDFHIVDASSGVYHSSAIDKDGRVFTWGWGGSFWEGTCGLGHGNSDSVTKPKLVQTLVDEGVRIAKVECGEKHTLALSNDGELWGFGNGEYGVMGAGDSSSFDHPEPLECFADMNIVSIAAGHSFSFAVNDEGAVYAWGKNDQGQLGLGGSVAMDVYSMENYPVPIESLAGVKIVQVSAGNNHAAAVSDDGKLYMWGMKRSLEPEEMTVLQGHNIISVSCGTNFTAALSDAGELFTFGKGSCSALGHGDRKTLLQPTLVQALSDSKVLSISCGARFMGVTAESKFAADKDFSLRE